MKPLANRIAVVAGATRGAGRGIAVMLGEAGATVYCTGRSVAGQPPREGHYNGRRETIEQTAAQVTEHGGRGIAVRVDHASEAEVGMLAARIANDEGALDILVLDFWGDEAPHVLTLQLLTPLLLKSAKNRSGRPLVVEVTDGPALYYRSSLFFDLAATLRARLAYAIAEELAAEGITAVAVTPGYLRTELALDAHGVSESNWRDGAATDSGWLTSESPSLLGRGIAALAADPQSKRFAGGLYGSWVLAREYGLTDRDGSQPDFGRHFRETYGEGPGARQTGARWSVAHTTPTQYEQDGESKSTRTTRR